MKANHWLTRFIFADIMHRAAKRTRSDDPATGPRIEVVARRHRTSTPFPESLLECGEEQRWFTEAEYRAWRAAETGAPLTLEAMWAFARPDDPPELAWESHRPDEGA